MNLKLIALATLLSLGALSTQAQEASPTTPVHKAMVHHRATASKTVAKTAKATKARKPRKVTPKMQAARDRMHQCGAEWKRDKAAGHTKGTTWPKYWHTCSVRLKAKA